MSLRFPWQRGGGDDVMRAPSGVDETTSRDASDDQALDALAGLVRIYARYGAGLSAAEAGLLEKECDAWARHILTLTPTPGDSGGEPPTRRDWPGFRAFFQARRQQESTQVSQSLSDLREAIWTLIDSLSAAFTQDQDLDSSMSGQLETLRQTVGVASVDELKAAVLDAVSTLTVLVDERKKRQDERIFKLGSTVSALSHELQEVRKESALDPLTRLFTRKPFEDYLNKASYLRRVFGQPYCVLMVDLDHFKTINDTHGHQNGDVALKVMSDCLVRSFPRKSDFVARFGGDEFAVILSGTTLPEGLRLAERFVHLVRGTPVPVNGLTISMTASVGIAELERGEATESWLARADAALYEAKRAGRNQVSSGALSGA